LGSLPSAVTLLTSMTPDCTDASMAKAKAAMLVAATLNDKTAAQRCAKLKQGALVARPATCLYVANQPAGCKAPAADKKQATKQLFAVYTLGRTLL
jgi:hypothetical protein